MLKFRLLGEWCALLLATLLVVLGAWQLGWTNRLDSTLLDFANSLNPGESSDEIVVVAIDDRALEEIGNWPWDRDRHADLVNELAIHDPKLIVFDILFLNPIEGGGDERLAEAMANAGNVMLPYMFTQAPGTTNELAPVLPLDTLTEAAANIGHVAVMPDSDGVVRRFDLEFEAGGQSHDHLAKVVFLALGRSPQELPGGIVPMQESGSFRTYSAADVVNQRVTDAILRDKIVIIGATAQGLGDRYAVSAYGGRIMPGVEIQANLLNSLLRDQAVTQLAPAGVATIMVATILALFVVFWRFPPKWTLRISLALIAALVLMALSLVVFAQVWVPVFPAILGVLFAYPVWGWRRLSSVSRFLKKEAIAMAKDPDEQDVDESLGFDIVARQVEQVRGLMGETRERLAFLRRTLASSPDAILVFDEERELALMNRRAEELFGEELSNVNRTLDQLVAQSGAEFSAAEDELQFPDGRSFLIASSRKEMRGGGEIVSLRDITGLRNSERQRREMLEFLSHDMRSPQAAIVGLVGSAGDTLPQDERLDRIEKQARRTLKLADDFVQIARLEHEGIRLQDCDLCELMHEAVDRAYASAKRKNITFKVAIPSEPEFCQVDPFSLARAIDNLIDNAVKFSPEGETVEVILERADNSRLKIEIRDNAAGLPEERKHNTFARFGAREVGAGPSAGLGLAYTKQVIDEHRGTISAGPNGETGTRFTILIPFADAK